MGPGKEQGKAQRRAESSEGKRTSSDALALSSPHPTEFSGGAPTAGINPFRDFKLTPFYKAPAPPSPLPGKGGGGRLESESNPPAPRSYEVLRADALAKKCKIIAVVCKICRETEIFPVQCEKNAHSPRATRGEEDSIARPQDKVAVHASLAKNGNVRLFRTAKPTPGAQTTDVRFLGKGR